MRQYRLSKYDPTFRDAKGIYTRDEWTFFAQVGTVVYGKVVTLAEYEAKEAAYIRVVCSLVDASSIGPYVVSDLEGTHAELQESTSINRSALPSIMRSLLREEYWCRLTDSFGHFIHVGWDLYLYLGLPDNLDNPEAIASAEELFLETFESPYHADAD